MNSLDAALAGRRTPGRNGAPPKAVLWTVLSEWMRLEGIASVPRPLCEERIEKEHLANHLWSCASHPSLAPALELETWLDQKLGENVAAAVRGAVAEHERLLTTLRTLTSRSLWFDSKLGWAIELAKSAVGDETSASPGTSFRGK